MEGVGLVLVLLAAVALYRADAHVTPSINQDRRTVALAGRLTRVLIWAGVLFAAGIALLASSILLILTLAMAPNAGADATLQTLKIVDVGGWLTIGAWLLYEYRLVRPAVVLPPIVAWVWVYAMGTISGESGYLPWGP
jgi:hypothetical protein